MELNKGFEMKLKRFAFWFIGLSVLFIIYKLCVIETDVERIQFVKETLVLLKDQLQLTSQQMVFLERAYQVEIGNHTPTIFAITPTYARYVQKAELTRISQTLMLVPNIHWVVIEDAEEKSDLVRNLLIESHVLSTHLTAKTPPFQKSKDKNSRWKHHRGVEQRNAALKWLRDNYVKGKDRGIVYFMDDDNTYSFKLFKEIRKVKKVGIWPVGLVGGLTAESPIIDPDTGKVTGYRSGWKPNRPFAIDMAGFAINLDLILSTPDAWFSHKMEKGLQESEFLSYFTTKEELEPLADNCTKVYVWHTRTENPVVNGIVPGLEV